MTFEELKSWENQNGFMISVEVLIERLVRLGMLTEERAFTGHFIHWYDSELKCLFETHSLEWVEIVTNGCKRALRYNISRPCLLGHIAVLLVGILKEKEKSFLQMIKLKEIQLAHLYLLFASILIERALTEGVLLPVGDGLYTLPSLHCTLEAREFVSTYA